MKTIQTIFIVFLLFNSCKLNKNKSDDTEIPNKITKDITDTKLIKDSIKKVLPIGSNLLLKDFPKTVLFKNKPLNIIIDSIFQNSEKIDNRSTSDCFVSNKKTTYMYFDPKEILEDTINVNYETMINLPSKYGYAIYIDKKSEKCKSNIDLETNYYLSISNGKRIINRYNIGYTLFGDLSESTKYWYIDENFLIYTRKISVVSGNEEFYIGDLNTYTIIDSGSLATYFDKSDGAYSSKIEEGYIKNHLKDGKWIEKKANFGYVNNETYGVGNYKNGVQIGMWYYFMLKKIEEANDQGYITKTYTKKTEQLLMTEEYSETGVLLKREIFDN